jgi:hypothetical protein
MMLCGIKLNAQVVVGDSQANNSSYWRAQKKAAPGFAKGGLGVLAFVVGLRKA